MSDHIVDANKMVPDQPYHCATHGAWSPMKESGCPTCVREARRIIARLTEELDRYKRISESGESLGGELEERERRMALEAENEALKLELKERTCRAEEEHALFFKRQEGS